MVKVSNVFRLLTTLLVSFLMICLFTLLYTEVQAQEETLIQMSFRDADLRDVFRTLSDLAGVNLLVHHGVAGRISINLDNLTFLDSMHLITQMYDFDYIQYKDTFFVGSPQILDEVMKKEQTAIFTLSHMAVEEMKRFLSFLTPDVTLSGDKNLGILILGGSTKSLERAQEIIEKLDQESFRVEEYLFYPLHHADMNQAASILRALIPELRVEVDDRRGELILRGISSDLSKGEQLLLKLDQEEIVEKDFLVYPVQYVDLQVASSLITYLFTDVVSVIDEANGNLVLFGRQIDLNRAQEKLHKLDQEEILSKEIQFYSLQYGDGNHVANILRSFLPGLFIQVDEWNENLILQGDTRHLDQAMELLSQLDQEQIQEKEIYFYTLEHIDGAKLISILSALYPQIFMDIYEGSNELLFIGTPFELSSVKRTIPKLDREIEKTWEIQFFVLQHVEGNDAAAILGPLVPDLQIQVDSRSNTMIMKGESHDLERAYEILHPLDQEILSQRFVEVVPLQYADSSQVAGIIRSILPDVLVEVEARRGDLILSGTENQMAEAMDIISSLDEEFLEEREVIVYLLEHADSHQIASLLSSLIPDLFAEPGGRKKIVISGSREDLKWGEQLLAQLDKELTEDKRVQIFPLEYADCDQVAGIIRSIIPDLLVEVDERNRALIVSGTDNELEKVTGLLSQLDQKITDEHQVQFYPLQYADALQVSEMLTFLVPDLLLQVQEERDELILIGRAGDLKKGIELLIQLDGRGMKEEKEEEEKELKIYSLQYADGYQLKELFSSLLPHLLVEVDGRNNNLILQGTSIHLEKAIHLLSDLDEPMKEERELRIYSLEHAEADTISSSLAALLPDLLVEVDTRSQALILSGTFSELEQARDLLLKLDGELEEEEEMMFYTLRHADSSEIPALLFSLVPDLVVQEDKHSGDLILKGTRSQLNQAAELLQKIDRVVEEEHMVSLYPLQYADGVYLKDFLSSLLPQLVVMVEERSGNLILKGVSSTVEQAKALLHNLDMEIHEDWEVQYYPLQYAEAVKVASLLASLISNIQVEVEESRNILLVVGSKTDLERTARLIQGLDQKVDLVEEEGVEVAIDEIETVEEREHLVQPLNYATAADVGRILSTFIPDLLIEIKERTNSLILGGTPHELTKAQGLIQELDQKVEKEAEMEKEVIEVDPSLDKELEEENIVVHVLEFAAADEMARILQSFIPALTVEVFAHSKLMVLRGSKEELKQAQDLIGKIDIQTLIQVERTVEMTLQGITGNTDNRIAFIATKDKTFIVGKGDPVLDFLVEEVEQKKVLLRDETGILYALHLGGGYFEYR